MFVLALVIALLNGVTFIVLLSVFLTMNINGRAFMAQIMKLAMANSIDKAIKLCNAAPKAVLAQVSKHMLIRANRPYSIELEYVEGARILTDFRQRIDHYFLYPQMAILGFGVASIFYGPGNTGVETPLYVAAGIFLLNASLWRALSHSFRNQLCELHHLRTLLFGRQDYAPPQYKPTKMSKEEILAWRESMRSFEEDLAERRKQGEDFNANEEYAKKAAPNGVLPPL